MRIIAIITITIVLSFFSFIFLNYQSLYENYVYAFKPKNAPAANETLNITKETIITSSNPAEKIITSVPLSATLQTYQFINADGSYIQLDSPTDIAVDSSNGNVYVTERENNRVQKFDSNGHFITKWGSYGTGDGEFSYPSGIAVDSSNGNVYVTELNNHRVQKFDSNGHFITKWGSYGTGDGEFFAPEGISIDSSNGYVYVTERENNRVQKFDSNGHFITKWGSYGTGDGEFSYPIDIAIDSQDNVYVVDTDNYRVQKFDSNGHFITKWGSYGTGDGEFDYPDGIAIDSSNNVYVVDTYNDLIQIFDSNGNFMTKWELNSVSNFGFAVDYSNGNVYVLYYDGLSVFALTSYNNQPKIISETKIPDDTDVLINWEGIPQTNISNDVNELNFEGLNLYGVNNFQEAIKWFDKALEIDPNYVDALYNKGNAFIQLGKYQEAIKWFDKALEIDPNNARVLHVKSNALKNQ